MTQQPAPPLRRVLLFFPVFHSVLPAAFENFLRLVNVASRLLPQFLFDPWVVDRTSVHGAMNRAVDTAREYNHYALIAFDDDCIPELHEFPKGDPRRYQVIPRLLTLLEHHPIVAGTGYMRGYPYTTTVGREYEHGVSMVIGHEGGQESLSVKGYHWVEDVDSPEWRAKQDSNGLLDVAFCGVPIVAIRQDVLLRVPDPLFETRDYLGRASTHDVYFCNKARAHGFSIKVDTHIDCGHIVEAPVINRYSRHALREVVPLEPVIAHSASQSEDAK